MVPSCQNAFSEQRYKGKTKENQAEGKQRKWEISKVKGNKKMPP
jgi:hypothetical protein